MKENLNSWGSDVCSFVINPTPIALMHNVLNAIKSDSLQNLYDTGIISSEECLRNQNKDIFQKRIVRKNTPNQTSYYEALFSKNGDVSTSGTDYLIFSYHPYLRQGVFSDVLFRHYQSDGNETIKSFTDNEIEEMIHAQPNHPLLVRMTQTLTTFGDIQPEASTNTQTEKTTQNQPQ